MPFTDQCLRQGVDGRHRHCREKLFVLARRLVDARTALGRAAFRLVDGAAQAAPDVRHFHQAIFSANDVSTPSCRRTASRESLSNAFLYASDTCTVPSRTSAASTSFNGIMP